MATSPPPQKLFLWDAEKNALLQMGEKPLRGDGVMCYYCSEVGHTGRTCAKQFQVIVPSELTMEKIQQWDVSAQGDLEVGREAPMDCRFFDLATQKQLEMGSTVESHEKPFILIFGSSS